MKLKYTFETVDMGDEKILVPVGEGASNVQGVLRINQEGLDIVSLLKNEITEEQIVENLTDKYEDEKESLIKHVQRVLEELKRQDLIIY